MGGPRVLVAPTARRCHDCGGVYSLDNFDADPARPGGKGYTCKACRRARHRRSGHARARSRALHSLARWHPSEYQQLRLAALTQIRGAGDDRPLHRRSTMPWFRVSQSRAQARAKAELADRYPSEYSELYDAAHDHTSNRLAAEALGWPADQLGLY